MGGVLGVGLALGAIWFFIRRRRRQRAAAATMAMAPVPSSDRANDGYNPVVSQNYQHYAIELNNSSVPYHKQQLGIGHGPYETLLEDRPVELGTESRPQELPAR